MISAIWRGLMFRVCGILGATCDNCRDLEEDLELPTPIMFTMLLTIFMMLIVSGLIEWAIKKVKLNPPRIMDSFGDRFETTFEKLEKKFGRKTFLTPVGKISENDRANYYKYAKMFYKEYLLDKEYKQKTKDRIDDEYQKAREEQLIVKIAGLK